jgi:hypothetical protein
VLSIMNEEIELVGYNRQSKKVSFESFLAMKRVGVGWSELLTELCTKLFEAGWDGKILDCKEKFGSLRFHISPMEDSQVNDTLWDIVQQYEQKSTQFCEVCGSFPARPRAERSWIKTLCYDCASLDLSARPESYKPGTHYTD